MDEYVIDVEAGEELLSAKVLYGLPDKYMQAGTYEAGDYLDCITYNGFTIGDNVQIKAGRVYTITGFARAYKNTPHLTSSIHGKVIATFGKEGCWITEELIKV